MKKIFTTIVAGLITICLFAQAPQKMSYQAIIRDGEGKLVTTQVGMKISILQGNVDGDNVYNETQTSTPNINGLLTVEIGGGDPGTFATIDWSAGPYFIKTETAIAPPLTTYTITGTSEILSVPYALYANKSLSSHGAVTVWDDDQTIDGNKTFIGTITVPVPINATDAATKAYVDSKTPIHSIGESYGGGIVFYVYDNGKHGLIAATSDQSTGIVWTNTAFQSTVSNAVKDGINGGLANTERIIIQAGAGIYAAQLCANNTGGNYADWYLPSIYELNLLYLQKTVVGGFADDYYWSSTEFLNFGAWYRDFGNVEHVDYDNKEFTHYVRAIRAF